MNENNALRCPVAKKCGGCQLQNLSYERQLSFKQVKAIRALGSFRHVEEIIGMAHPLHYRNKVQAAFGKDHRGQLIAGVYQSASGRIVPVENCMIEDEKAHAIVETVRKLLLSFKLKPYNAETGEGFLRHVLIRRGFTSGEIMVVLVAGTNIFPKKNQFVNALRQRHEDISTVVFSVNAKHMNLLLGEKQEVLYGSGKIQDTLCGCRFNISPKSFYQVNPVQTEVLYGKAMEFAALTGSERVIDAYCGIGTIGIIAAKSGAQVLGVEINADAIRDAKENAALNGLHNIDFVCADAGKYMVSLAEEGKSADVLFMDPPRAGASKDFLRSAVTMGPKKIVYISCNIETQQRDLHFLVHNGYRVQKLQPVDMFPYTEHIENVALLVKK